MPDSHLVQQMSEQAQAVQTIVHRITDWDDAVGYVVDLTVRQHGKAIVALGFPAGFLAALKGAAERGGLTFLEPPLRNHLTSINTAVTMADWGIAETGTLVIDSSSEDLRIATMLSETHVAVLPAERIRADSLQLKDEITTLQMEPPRYLAFISGASRTADIERVLSIGVHGPQEVHILILEEVAS